MEENNIKLRRATEFSNHIDLLGAPDFSEKWGKLYMAPSGMGIKSTI